jgi:dihydrofolate synthase/folylpolyglutamate synthase
MQLDAPLQFAQDRFVATIRSSDLASMDVELEDLAGNVQLDFRIETGATYQLENIVTAMASLNQLKNNFSKLTDKSIIEGLSHFKSITRFTGRWQVLQEKGPMILADCAHNYSALKVVMDQVLRLSFHRLHCVIGTVNDKDLNTFISVLPKEAVYYFCSPNVPRGLDATQLKEAAAAKGFNATSYPTVERAFRSAVHAAGPDDLVYVGGSIFVVAEII